MGDAKSSRASAQRDVGNLWSSRNPRVTAGKSARSCPWARKSPCPDTSWEAAGWGAALLGRTCGLQQMPGWSWANSVLLSSVKQTPYRATLGGGKLITPFYLARPEGCIQLYRNRCRALLELQKDIETPERTQWRAVAEMPKSNSCQQCQKIETRCNGHRLWLGRHRLDIRVKKSVGR